MKKPAVEFIGTFFLVFTVAVSAVMGTAGAYAPFTIATVLAVCGKAAGQTTWYVDVHASAPGSGTPVIVPLALWQAERNARAARGEVGVWLKPNDDPDVLASDVAHLPLIAIDFPKFVDGRGYSSARLLRDKYRFGGELRAIGDVLRESMSR